MTTKRLQAPGLDLSKIVGIVGIPNGGTNADTAPVAVTNLGGLRRSTAGQANKPVPIGSNGKIDISFFDAVSGNYVSLTGPNSVVANEIAVFNISNYDSWKSYTVSATVGTVSIYGSVITYTAPASGTNCGFTINGRIINLNLSAPYLNEPTVTIANLNTANTTAFSTGNGSDTHEGTDWQLATDVNFSNIIQQLTNSSSNKLTWNLTSYIAANTTYYVRARHKGVNFGYSNWSATATFTTTSTPTVSKPSITYPSNNGINISPNQVTFISSAFNTVNASDTHQGSEWQISGNINFSVVEYQKTLPSTDLTSWTPSGLNMALGQLKYVRVRHYGATIGFSEWSDPVAFTTASVYITKPVILTPTHGTTGLGASVVVTSNAYSDINSTNDHVSSDWQLLSADGYQTVIQQSLNDTVNKTSWTINDLDPNTQYLVQVKYHNSQNGNYNTSQYSNQVSFTTKVNFYLANTNIYGQLNSSNNNSYYNLDSIAITSDGLFLALNTEGNNLFNIYQRNNLNVGYSVEQLYNQVAPLYTSAYNASPYDNRGEYVCLSQQNSNTLIALRAGKARSPYGSYGCNFVTKATINISNATCSETLFYLNNENDLYPTPTVVINSLSSNDIGDKFVASYYTFDNSNNKENKTEIVIGATPGTSTRVILTENNPDNINLGTISNFDKYGNRLIIGNPYKNVDGNFFAGEVVVRKLNTTTEQWDIEATFNYALGGANSYYGMSVALSPQGNKAAIAYKSDTGQIKVDIYTRTGSVWNNTPVTITLTNRVNLPIINYLNIIDEERFKPNSKNIKFTFDNSRIVIGAPYFHNETYNINYGVVYVYDISQVSPVKTSMYLNMDQGYVIGDYEIASSNNSNKTFDLGETICLTENGENIIVLDPNVKHSNGDIEGFAYLLK